MRVVWLVILAVVLGAAGFVLLFKRDWLFKTAGEGMLTAQGYTPARTASEAMEKFTAAIKDRNYRAAAVYCSGDYGEQLKRAHPAASAVGNGVDRVMNLMKDRGLETDLSRALLTRLDPFPPAFKVKDVQTKGDKALGVFISEAVVKGPPEAELRTALATMDTRVLSCVLLHPAIYSSPVDIVADGVGEGKQWRLVLPLPPEQRLAIDQFIEKHRAYVSAMDHLNEEARRGRFSHRNEFENEVSDALRNAK